MKTNLVYQIKVCGQIPDAWGEAFADLEPEEKAHANGVITILHGTFEDTAALQGVLNNLCMLGLVLISIDSPNECLSVSKEEKSNALQ